ncbi:DNA primase [Rhodococcus phage Mbo2]|uniref:DNA primase n=1 Tax=Rhodococcus phage Mbo2 TaxID=2936911 RepID=A0A9E7IFR4_9CAUD|nr:DNA primase [Rhodococcus phage Mbo2]
MTQPVTDFQARLAALRESQAAAVPQPVSPAQPVISAPKTEGTLDDGAKSALRELDLLTVYKRWFNPVSERQGGNDEVNLSCFNDDFHKNGDRNPQFGINTRTNVYYCHACEVSGDIIDLAANHYGYADGNHKCPPDLVHVAVKDAGTELCGFKFKPSKAGYQRENIRTIDVGAVAGGKPVSVPPVVPPAAAVPAPDAGGDPAAPGSGESGRQAVPVPALNLGPAPAAPGKPAGGLVLATFAPRNASATPNLAGFTPPAAALAPAAPSQQGTDPDPEDDDERILAADFGLDWRSLVPENTPLRMYLDIVTADDSPEEFHFWNFMSLIGLTMGKKVFIPDGSPVFGNLFTCVIGRTGLGKSRAEKPLNSLILKAAKFDEDDHQTNGIRVVKNPGSGEYIMKQFGHEVPDPASPPGQKRPNMLRNASVKALIRWPEMATMVGKSAGRGSIISQTIIELYDCPDHIGGGSLTNGTYGADNPFGAVATTTQLDAIRKLVSGDDVASGFLNRWLFVIGPEKPVQPFIRILDMDPMVPHVKRLLDWSERRNRVAGGHQWFTDDALLEARRFLIEVAHPLEKEDAILARSMVTFKKLCLLFSANMMEDGISLAAVKQAEVAFDYLIDCLKHIGVRIARSEGEIHEQAIMDHIRKFPLSSDMLKQSQIRQKVSRKQGIDPELVDRLLERLEGLGVIEKFVPAPTAGSKIGRPKATRWMLREED